MLVESVEPGPVGPEMIATEGQARELTGIEDTQVADVVAAVAERCEDSGEEPTAKVIRP